MNIRRMNIHEISANIDRKLAQLDSKITKIREQQAKGETEPDQLAKDLAALENIKHKLQKSRDIMWQAHHLQRDGNQRVLQQKRWLGIGLMVFSGLGLLVILAIVLLR